MIVFLKIQDKYNKLYSFNKLQHNKSINVKKILYNTLLPKVYHTNKKYLKLKYNSLIPKKKNNSNHNSVINNTKSKKQLKYLKEQYYNIQNYNWLFFLYNKRSSHYIGLLHYYFNYIFIKLYQKQQNITNKIIINVNSKINLKYIKSFLKQIYQILKLIITIIYKVLFHCIKNPKDFSIVTIICSYYYHKFYKHRKYYMIDIINNIIKLSNKDGNYDNILQIFHNIILKDFDINLGLLCNILRKLYKDQNIIKNLLDNRDYSNIIQYIFQDQSIKLLFKNIINSIIQKKEDSSMLFQFIIKTIIDKQEKKISKIPQEIMNILRDDQESMVKLFAGIVDILQIFNDNDDFTISDLILLISDINNIQKPPDLIKFKNQFNKLFLQKIMKFFIDNKNNIIQLAEKTMPILLQNNKNYIGENACNILNLNFTDIINLLYDVINFIDNNNIDIIDNAASISKILMIFKNQSNTTYDDYIKYIKNYEQIINDAQFQNTVCCLIDNLPKEIITHDNFKILQNIITPHIENFLLKLHFQESNINYNLLSLLKKIFSEDHQNLQQDNYLQQCNNAIYQFLLQILYIIKIKDTNNNMKIQDTNNQFSIDKIIPSSLEIIKYFLLYLDVQINNNDNFEIEQIITIKDYGLIELFNKYIKINLPEHAMHNLKNIQINDYTIIKFIDELLNMPLSDGIKIILEFYSLLHNSIDQEKLYQYLNSIFNIKLDGYDNLLSNIPIIQISYSLYIYYYPNNHDINNNITISQNIDLVSLSDLNNNIIKNNESPTICPQQSQNLISSINQNILHYIKSKMIYGFVTREMQYSWQYIIKIFKIEKTQIIKNNTKQLILSDMNILMLDDIGFKKSNTNQTYTILGFKQLLLKSYFKQNNKFLLQYNITLKNNNDLIIKHNININNNNNTKNRLIKLQDQIIQILISRSHASALRKFCQKYKAVLNNNSIQQLYNIFKNPFNSYLNSSIITNSSKDNLNIDNNNQNQLTNYKDQILSSSYLLSFAYLLFPHRSKQQITLNNCMQKSKAIVNYCNQKPKAIFKNCLNICNNFGTTLKNCVTEIKQLNNMNNFNITLDLNKTDLNY